MKILYSKILYGIPRTKKNRPQIIRRKGRPFLIQDAKYLRYEKECVSQIAFNKTTIDAPINLKIVIYKKNKIRSDLVGYLQSITDILVKSKVILDDYYRIVRSYDGSTVYIDKESPRVVIEISKSIYDGKNKRDNKK